MTSRAIAGLDVERALGGAVSELAANLRRDARDADGADPLAAVLATHALTESVRGCAVCVIDGKKSLRIVAVAGTTGDLTVGSVWDLATTPLPEVLAAPARIRPVPAEASTMGRALHVAAGGQLVAAPVRLEDEGAGEALPLGALLLVRDRAEPLADDEFGILRRVPGARRPGAAPVAPLAGT